MLCSLSVVFRWKVITGCVVQKLLNLTCCVAIKMKIFLYLLTATSSWKHAFNKVWFENMDVIRTLTAVKLTVHHVNVLK